MRRWVAPHGGKFSVNSAPIHEVAAGNGIRCWIVSGRQGVLASLALHNQRQEMNVAEVALEAGETLDFVVDINADLNNDQYQWAPVISEIRAADDPAVATAAAWQAERDFAGNTPTLLNRWEQLAQVLLVANELMFVD